MSEVAKEGEEMGDWGRKFQSSGTYLPPALSLIYPFTQSSLIHSSTHSLTHSLIHSCTHAHTHSLLKARKSMSIPAAIITKLEDCPDWLDRMLAKAYWEAEYHLESPNLKDERSILFRFEARSKDLDPYLDAWNIQSFAIITAFNPGSAVLSLEENLHWHAALRETLLPHCRVLLNSTGQNTDGSWQEQGFWALDIDLEKAAEIGAEFGQQAIVCWKRGRPVELWWLYRLLYRLL